MTSVGIFEAKTHLSELVDRVSRGEVIEITRHGKPVARLTPVHEGATAPPSSEDVIASLRSISRQSKLTRDEIVSIIREGRARRHE